MAEFCGLLIIRLIAGSNLPSASSLDLIGRTDAFCELNLGDRKAKSKTVKNTSDPHWAQTLMINVRARLVTVLALALTLTLAPALTLAITLALALTLAIALALALAHRFARFARCSC